MICPICLSAEMFLSNSIDCNGCESSYCERCYKAHECQSHESELFRCKGCGENDWISDDQPRIVEGEKYCLPCHIDLFACADGKPSAA